MTGIADDASQPSSAVGEAKGWLTVAVLMLLAVVSSVDRTILALLVEPIRSDLAIGDFQIAMLQGLAFGLFYAGFGIPLGWALDRFSKRHVVFWGVAFWSVSATVCGLARSYGQLFIARLGVGAGEAVLSPGAYTMISSLFPPRRLSLAIGLYAIGTIVGGSIALSAGGAIIDWTTGLGPRSFPLLGTLQPWQMTFIITGLPGIFFAPLIFLAPRARPSTKRNHDDTSVFAALRMRKAYYAFHFTGFGMVTMLAYAYLSWLPTFMIRHFEIGIREIGFTLGAVNLVGGVAGFIVCGLVTDRRFASGVLNAQFRYALGAAIMLVVAGLVAFQTESLVICLACCLVIAFCVCISGGAAAHLQIVTPVSVRGRVSAIYLLAMNILGLVLSPLIVAGLTDFVFGDPAMIGKSLAITFAAGGSIAAVAFACGLGVAAAAVPGQAPDDCPPTRTNSSEGNVDGIGRTGQP